MGSSLRTSIGYRMVVIAGLYRQPRSSSAMTTAAWEVKTENFQAESFQAESFQAESFQGIDQKAQISRRVGARR
jgi:hypothetical protein